MNQDNFNFLDYLLTMSFRYKSYKEVSRNYIDSRLLNKINEECESEFCSNCMLMKHIRSELSIKGYYSSNKHVKWWRINHYWGSVTVDPVIENDSKTG